MANRTCSVDGCDREFKARGWCRFHYERWRTKGDPLLYFKGNPDLIDYRFWSNVREADPGELSPNGTTACWIYSTGRGYGRFLAGKRLVLAHRYAYEFVVGVIPDGLQLDHLCRRPACVNPAHLEPVTPKENSRRSVNPRSLLTHCPAGHPYDEANTYYPPREGNSRKCRACQRDRQRRLRNESVQVNVQDSLDVRHLPRHGHG